MSANGGGVAGLRFPFRELIDEVTTLSGMAGGLLVSVAPLIAHQRAMARIGEKSAERDRTLELQPLRTRPTRDYEPASRSGGLEVYAHMTGKWQVRPVGARRPNRQIAFTGSASAVVELWPARCLWREEHEESSRLAMWRIELGAHDSPGCYFHSQILGDRIDPPFPKSLPVPRLPSPFVTPMAAVEFVLGELFQDVWLRKASEARHHHQRWRAIQRRRWCDLLRWHEDAVRDGTSSPWLNLKAAKPPHDLFLSS